MLGITAAVVLLTGLVTSPLTQSLISYPTRYGPGNGTATAPRSELYSYSDVVVTATGKFLIIASYVDLTLPVSVNTTPN